MLVSVTKTRWERRPEVGRLEVNKTNQKTREGARGAASLQWKSQPAKTKVLYLFYFFRYKLTKKNNKKTDRFQNMITFSWVQAHRNDMFKQERTRSGGMLMAGGWAQHGAQHGAQTHDFYEENQSFRDSAGIVNTEQKHGATRLLVC